MQRQTREIPKCADNKIRVQRKFEAVLISSETFQQHFLSKSTPDFQFALR